MRPLILLTGPTASGKSALAIALAQCFHGEILSCDSVAVYRGMDVGSAKPPADERARVPHHLLDLLDPAEPCTAGDYARAGRAVLADLALRSVLPIVSGGTGLYARALIDGLSPAPQRNPRLRSLLAERAARRGTAHLHRTLRRFDPEAAARIHPNDVPKTIRAIEVSLYASTPITQQWAERGRDSLEGYKILRLTLDPPRAELYRRIDGRAATMFHNGLLRETAQLIAQFGAGCAPFGSLGYREAAAVLRGELSERDAIAAASQGHRNYAKRQLTWFRREAQLRLTEVITACGDSPAAIEQTCRLAAAFLQT